VGKPHTKKSPAQRNIEYTARLEKKKGKKMVTLQVYPERMET
jgi:hypothetical protein